MKKILIGLTLLVCIIITGCGEGRQSNSDGQGESLTGGTQKGKKSDVLICLGNNTSLSLNDDLAQQLKDNNLKVEYSIYEDNIGARSKKTMFLVTNVGKEPVELWWDYSYKATKDSSEVVGGDTDIISALQPDETVAVVDIIIGFDSEMDAEYLEIKVENKPVKDEYVSVLEDIQMKTSIIEKEKSSGLGTDTCGRLEFAYNGDKKADIDGLIMIFFKDNVPVDFGILQFEGYNTEIEPGYTETIDDETVTEVDSCKVYVNMHRVAK